MSLIHVHAYFLADLRDALLERLRQGGFRVGRNPSAQDVCIAHFNIQKRWITPRARAVEIARELRNRVLSSSLHAAIGRIRRLALAGNDLNPFQSDKIQFATAKDKLLYDWGIHHLHLGPLIRGQFFAGRTRELLYVLVEKERVGLIDVLHHGSFSDHRLIEIVHRNWPEAIRRYVAPRTTTPTTFSNETRALLRKKGLQTLVAAADGTVYAAPGGGYTSNGTSADALMRADMLMAETRHRQESCVREAEQIRQAILSANGIALSELQLKLVATNEGPIIMETQSEIQVNLVAPPARRIADPTGLL
jgi:hypothetical protein